MKFSSTYVQAVKESKNIKKSQKPAALKHGVAKKDTCMLFKDL